MEPTQADRNAAVRLLEAGDQDWQAKEIRAGAGDHFPIVQAFARHRIAHSPPASKPHCSTCGKDVQEILCPTCAKWWNDNPPPASGDEGARWSCSCGWSERYTQAEVAEYGKPDECPVCFRERLVEETLPTPSATSTDAQTRYGPKFAHLAPLVEDETRADAPRDWTNTDIKTVWRKHGGAQHGPMVEQYYIEEQAFYRFARELIALANDGANHVD